MFQEKYKQSFVDLILRHVKKGDYVVDAKLCAELGISYDTLYRWVASKKEFAKAYNLLKLARVGALVDKMVEGSVSPQCGKFLFDAFDEIIPSSVRRDLDRKDRELEARLTGDLTDTANEFYVNFVPVTKREDEDV